MASVGTIHFIRHGDTEASGDGVFCGDLDIPLAPSGVVQADVLAAAIGKWKVDAIYSSPKLRARMTAAPTCRAPRRWAPRRQTPLRRVTPRHLTAPPT